MGEISYQVVFKGELTEGADPANVKKSLAAYYNKDEVWIEKLFSGQSRVVKKNATREACEKIKEIFKNAGAICYIKEENKVRDKDVSQPPESSIPPPIPDTIRLHDHEKADGLPLRQAGEKFCESCGEIIRMNVLSCPHCGKKVKVEKSGCLPGIVIAIAVGFVMIAIIGILAAIAIPQFISYRHRAYEVTIKSELNKLLLAESEYYLNNRIYTSNLDELNMEYDSQIALEISNADKYCFDATATHISSDVMISADCEGILE